MFCPNCGTQNAESVVNCAKCAYALRPAGPAAPQKFKGTMMMAGGDLPGAPLAPAAPAPVGQAGPPSKLKGTMVGVAPPMFGSAPAPEQAPVNPLGSTMMAQDNYAAPPAYNSPAQGYAPPADPYAQPSQGYAPPADPYAQAPQGYGAPPADPYAQAPQGYAQPAPADPYAQAPQGYGQQVPQGYGAPADPYAQPAAAQYGAPAGFGQPPAPQGYGAPPPAQDAFGQFGGAVNQGAQAAGAAFGQAGAALGSAFDQMGGGGGGGGMQPYQGGPPQQWGGGGGGGGPKGQVGNGLTVLLISMVTCGIYQFIWFMKIAGEINGFLGRDAVPVGKIFGLGILTCGAYAFYWQFAELGKIVQEVQAKAGVPNAQDQGFMYLVPYYNVILLQNELNKAWQMPG
jgi:hypothetical protein